jgi:hypothetical protein
VPARVLVSFENDTGNLCVEIFVRDDGTFGFEESRRDPEDLSDWFPLHRYSHLVFETQEQALADARARVGWMAKAS